MHAAQGLPMKIMVDMKCVYKKSSISPFLHVCWLPASLEGLRCSQAVNKESSRCGCLHMAASCTQPLTARLTTYPISDTAFKACQENLCCLFFVSVSAKFLRACRESFSYDAPSALCMTGANLSSSTCACLRSGTH